MAKTSYTGLQTYDLLGEDKNKSMYDVLSNTVGIAPDSNMNKIDKTFETQNQKLEDLKKNKTIKNATATLASSSTNLDFYTIVSDIEAYEDKMLILCSFSANNKQKTQGNINNFGTLNFKKYNSNSELVELTVNDIKKDVLYLWQLNQRQTIDYYGDMILVGEDVNAKEPSFTKNTAFNKNFGTGNSDVARGNSGIYEYVQTALNTLVIVFNSDSTISTWDTNDYEKLINKPTINNQIIVGNKKGHDIGLLDEDSTITNDEIYEMVRKDY